MKRIKLPAWLSDDLRKFAIGAAILLAIFIVVGIVVLVKKYATYIIAAACAIAASYAIGSIVLHFTQEAKQRSEGNSKSKTINLP